MRVVDKIAAMRRKGMTERQIARDLGIKPNSVTSMEARARRRAAKAPQSVRVSGCVMADLTRAADARGFDVDTLINRLLHCIAVDDLVAAILDDDD